MRSALIRLTAVLLGAFSSEKRSVWRFSPRCRWMSLAMRCARVATWLVAQASAVELANG